MKSTSEDVESGQKNPLLSTVQWGFNSRRVNQSVSDLQLNRVVATEDNLSDAFEVNLGRTTGDSNKTKKAQ